MKSIWETKLSGNDLARKQGFVSHGKEMESWPMSGRSHQSFTLDSVTRVCVGHYIVSELQWRPFWSRLAVVWEINDGDLVSAMMCTYATLPPAPFTHWKY